LLDQVVDHPFIHQNVNEEAFERYWIQYVNLLMRRCTVMYEIARRWPLKMEKHGDNSRKKQQAIKNKTETPTHFHQRI
jgi:hypothetical protein